MVRILLYIDQLSFCCCREVQEEAAAPHPRPVVDDGAGRQAARRAGAVPGARPRRAARAARAQGASSAPTSQVS